MEKLGRGSVIPHPAAGAPRDNKSVPEKGLSMKREDVAAIFPDASDEQITAILNAAGKEANDWKTKFHTASGELSRLKDGPTAEKLQAEIDRADALQKELEGFKAADSIRQIREKIAGEKNLPAALLTAETEEACAAQADAILAFAKPAGYPSVQDGGDPHKVATSSTGKQFAEWAKQIL